MSRRKSLEFSGCVQIEGEEDGYDALTGLPDRTTLERRIERCLAQKGRPFSLIVIDIDAYDEHLHHERAERKLREAEIEEKYRPAAVSYDEVKARVDQLIEAAEHLGAHD